MIEIVFYAEECGEGRTLAGMQRVPVIEWLDGLPASARLRLLSRLELLEMQGAHFGRPHSVRLGERLRAVWCRCDGARHLIMYALAADTVDTEPHTAVLLSGLSVIEPLHIIVTGHSTASRAAFRPALGRTHASPAPQDDLATVERLISMPTAWSVPPHEIALAIGRFERYEAAPPVHSMIPGSV